MNTNIYFWSYIDQFFFNGECSRQKVLKSKTRILRSVTFFERRAVYEIMWKKIL